MRAIRPRQRITAWLCLWVVVWGACLPVLTQAAARASGMPTWVEVCTGTGMAWVNLDQASTSQDDAPANSLTDAMQCPWCLVQQAAQTLPPHGACMPDGNTASTALLSRWSQAPPLRPIAWPPALPRAPPLHA